MGMVNTTHGLMDDSLLEKTEGVSEDNEHEKTEFVEYRLAGELVHRSVHVTLKENIGTAGQLGEI